MTKTINIYIDTKDKKRLDEIKYKYHLSYSTIVSLICKHYYPYMGAKLESCYLYGKENQRKTSIKPNTIDLLKNYIKKPSFVYTNLVKIFVKSEELKYLEFKTEDEQIKTKTFAQLKSKLYTDFDNTYDENWDGNKFARQMPRFIKKNKDYIKKILELD